MTDQQGNTSTVWELNPIATAALKWHDAGCSVIPVRADRTKKPLLDHWKRFMSERPSREDVLAWFDSMPRAAIAVICGEVSGNLEMLELEGRATSSEHLDKILDACEARGVGHIFEGLLRDGYAEWTPSGGLHLLYRLDREVPGNTKVARRPATAEEIQEQIDAGIAPERVNRIKVLSETRGEGGYTVVAPSTGHVYHPGDSWSTGEGSTIGRLPVLSWDLRTRLHEAIHAAIDEMPAPAAPAPRPSPASLLTPRTDRPGDDFNQRADWNDILTPHGWAVHHVAGHTTYWTRPGKAHADGHSATTGRAADGDRLYVFSSSTEFDPEVPYTKFAAYTLLEHHGDYAAAARELGRRGYGSPRAGDDARIDPAAGVGTLRHPVPVETAPVAAGSAQTGQELEPAAGDKEKAPAHRMTATTWAAPTFPKGTFADLEPLADDGALMFAHLYSDQFKWAGDTNQWWFFNGTVWRRDRTERHDSAARHMLRGALDEARATEDTAMIKWATKQANNATITLARLARNDCRIAIESTQLDAQGNNFATQNGTYNLDTHTFSPVHDPKQLITKMVPVNYDKDAAAPRWDQFLRDVMPDEQMRGYLQKAIGFTLHGSARERAMFLLHGLSGTGKSQFIRAMELLFGDHAETASSQAFSAASKTATITNDLNDLRGKRFVALSELDEDEKLNESLLKRLTGGDTAKSRGLYQENSQWRVTFALWMATNHLPRLSSDDNAIWRRVKPILFPVVQQHTEHGEIASIAESIFAEEASGILNWALEGVRLYLSEGLGDPPQITEAVAAYRRDVDTAAQFLEAGLDEGSLTQRDDVAIGVRQLHTMYSEWCKRNNIRPLGERRFSSRLESLGHERRKAAAGIQWQGLGIGNMGLLGTMHMRQ